MNKLIFLIATAVLCAASALCGTDDTAEVLMLLHEHEAEEEEPQVRRESAHLPPLARPLHRREETEKAEFRPHIHYCKYGLPHRWLCKEDDAH